MNQGNNSSLLIEHINVRSLFPKFNNYLLENKYNIFAATETWLTDQIGENKIRIDGFNSIRSDRNYGRGGGILLYIM